MMQISVQGLWHLGTVTAACIGEHFVTRAYDPDAGVVARLAIGHPPILEPRLPELTQAGVKSGRLTFTPDLRSSLEGADLVWVCFDTPVDENDLADNQYVAQQIEKSFPYLREDALVLISSQVRVGFTAQMERNLRSKRGSSLRVHFAYSPENLRLGSAIEAFQRPERVVIGTNAVETRERLGRLFAPFCQRIEWMSVESAEMTKHALNSFLATSIAFANEVAVLCEQVGADAKEVERGLKSDARIGSKAYLSPGGPFSGGTLGRDVTSLVRTGSELGTSTPLIQSVLESNRKHHNWSRRTLVRLLGSLSGKTIAVLGLTYKSGTDTLRRSEAVELCSWLTKNGARVRAHDPAVSQLPAELAAEIELAGSPLDALRAADAMVLATTWSIFKEISASAVLDRMNNPIVVDPNRFLSGTLGCDTNIIYAAVGAPGATR